MINQRDAAVDRALSAKARLERLKRSPDFVKRYAAEDPDAVDAFNELVGRIAIGTEVARADVSSIEATRYGVPIAPDPNVTAQAAQAREQAVQGLLSNSDFARKYAAGDPAAIRAWREVSDEGAAAMLGVDPQQVAPRPAPGVQVNPSGVGSVTTAGVS